MTRERHICMNHDDCWIFDSNNDDPVCPKCKKTEWVFGYSGDKKPIRERSES